MPSRPEPIPLQQVLAHLKTNGPDGKPRPANLSFVTLNRRTGTGGRVKHLLGARLVARSEATANAAAREVPPSPAGGRKDPRHREHDTLNLWSPAEGITKAHVRLITKFNGADVVW